MDFLRNLFSRFGNKKKEGEAEKVVAELGDDAKGAEVKAEEAAKTVAETVEKAEEKVEAGVEKLVTKVEEVVESKPAEPEKTEEGGIVATANAALNAATSIVQNGVDESKKEIEKAEEEGNLSVDNLKKEVDQLMDSAAEKLTNGCTKIKDCLPAEITETNGLDASPSNEVVTAE